MNMFSLYASSSPLEFLLAYPMILSYDSKKKKKKQQSILNKVKVTLIIYFNNICMGIVMFELN